jgi:iron complex transport system substrate-binding protein
MIATFARPTAFERPLTERERRIIEDISRREFIIGGTALTALIAAGCGSDSDSSTETEGTEATGTRPFEHAMGTTDVPLRPQRIVSLHSTAFTWQLANLGVDSVATVYSPTADPTVYIRLVDPELADRLDAAGMVSVGESEPNIEAIAALEPDLIVGGAWQSDLYEQLSTIAPTVLLADDLRHDRFFGVEAALAELTGTTAELEAQHDAYDARVAELRERYGDRWASLRWIVIDEIDEQPDASLVGLDDSAPAFRVLRDLGAQLAPDAQALAADGPWAEVSAENLTALEADVIFVSPPWTLLQNDPATPISPTTLELLSGSTAGRHGQIFTVGLNWTNASVASFDVILDDLERFLSETGGFFTTAS